MDVLFGVDSMYPGSGQAGGGIPTRENHLPSPALGEAIGKKHGCSVCCAVGLVDDRGNSLAPFSVSMIDESQRPVKHLNTTSKAGRACHQSDPTRQCFAI